MRESLYADGNKSVLQIVEEQLTSIENELQENCQEFETLQTVHL